MTLMCVLVPCHDLLTHAAGLILNHHLVLMWSVEGGDGSLAWEVASRMLLFSVGNLRVCAR